MNASKPLHEIQRKNKRTGIAFIFLFTLSTLFPIVASVMNRNNEILKVAGFFDVLLAILCFILFAALYIIHAKRIDDTIISRTKKIVEYIATVPLLLIVLYLWGLTINWVVLLIGLGWRFWLLIMALPYVIATFQKPKG